MKYFKKKSKSSTVMFSGSGDFSKSVKLKKKDKKKASTITNLVIDETPPIDRLIDNIFDKRDPCFVDIGIEPNSLPVEYLLPVPIREIIISKNDEDGDYGFFLKKKVLTEVFNLQRKKVIFIDSVKHSAILGDRLLSVNGNPVDELTIEEVAGEIITSGAFAICQIQQVRELTEIYKFLLNYEKLNLWTDSAEVRKSSTFTNNDETKKPDFWLIHRYGLAQCFNEGKNELGDDVSTTICIPQVNIQGFMVNSDALERINPAELDFIEDFSNLWYLNESGIIHNLRSRYLNSLFNTFAGRSLICINSFMSSISLCDRMSAMFYKQLKINSLPPHIFSLAQRVYHAMQFDNKNNQTIVFMGHTQSGKGEVFKNSVSHLLRTPNVGELNRITMQKWTAMYSVLYAFTSFDGEENAFLEKMVILSSLHYDSVGSLVGGSLKVEFFDCFQMFKSNQNHNIFTYLLASLDEGQKLSFPNKNVRFDTDKDNSKNNRKWERFIESSSILDITQNEVNSIIFVLSGIYHLYCSLDSGNPLEHESFISASQCLNISKDALYCLVTDQRTLKKSVDREMVLAFTAALYQSLFDHIIYFINRSIAPFDKSAVSSTINLLYTPGVLTFDQPCKSLHSLFIGYFQEKVNQMQYNFLFKFPLELFGKEHIDIDGFYVQSTADEAVQVFESRGETHESTGILRLIDNTSRKGLSAGEFVSLILSKKNKYNNIIKPGTDSSSFIFMHSNSMLPIEYNCSDWPAEIGLYSRMIKAKNKLINSKIELISCNLLKKAYQYSLSFTSNPGTKMESIANDIIDIIARSDLSFVYCLCPLMNPTNNRRDSNIPTNKSSSHSSLSSGIMLNDIFDISFVRIQLRSMLIVQATLMFRYGYPDNLCVRTFVRAYSLLLGSDRPKNVGDISVITEIMQRAYIEAHDYAIGLDQIFMKDGVVVRLNDCRDRLIVDYMVSFQNKIRAYFSWIQFNKIRSIQASVRKIQYNMRTYLNLKRWKWWQLHVGLLPLASVSGMDGPIKSLKEKLVQNDANHANELEERNLIIDGLKKQVEELTKEMMEDKINLSEAGEVIETFIQENSTLKEQLKLVEDTAGVDTGLKIKELTLVISELETLVEKKNNDVSYWKRQTSRHGHQKLDLRRQASMNSSRPTTPNDENVEKLKTELSQLKESHSRQIKELEERVEYYKNKEKVRGHEVDSADRNPRLDSQLRVAQERIVELEDEASDLNQRFVRLQTHCHDVEGELTKIRFDENKLLDEAEDKFRAASREASAKCHNLEYILENERKKSSRLAECNEQLSRELEKSKKTANVAYNDVEKLKSKLSKARIMLNDAQLAHTAPREDYGISKLQKIIDENDTALKLITRAKSEVECELADCRILLESYNHSKIELENRLRDVMKQMNDNELLMEDKQIEMENAQRMMTSLKIETSLLGETVDFKDAEISTLKKQIYELRERVSELENDSSFRSKSNAENSSVIEGLRVKLDLSETQKNRFHTQLKSVRAELSDLKQETDELNMKIIQLNDQLRYSEKLTKSLENERDALNEDKEALSDKLVKLQRDISFVDETSQELRNENSFLRKRLMELQNSIKEDIKDTDSSTYVDSSDNEDKTSSC